ncbi:endosulfine alpha b [Etheostoma cragini]|uniref:endosulfine alpha b n=1 Tax=Etheostoma cragini TaxID=417921 RepID=UPI00155F24DE|nr:endosulfine alpha b [Etheostoma cragini]
MSHLVTPFLLGSSRVKKRRLDSVQVSRVFISSSCPQKGHLLVHYPHTMSSENLHSDTQVDYEDEKQDSQEKNANPVKSEEAKLKAKYPSLGQKPGGSDFLMKRLQKGQKYFDSGDYNMAKAKMKKLPVAGPDNNLVTGDHIPTPQDLPQRKSSLVTSKLAG